jgi:alpha-amylase
MTTKNTGLYIERGIYDSPFDAFTNYMNIVGDFIARVDSLYPADMDNEELNSLLTTIKNQGEEIAALTKELEKAQKKLAKLEPKEKAPAKKSCAKKAKKEE